MIVSDRFAQRAGLHVSPRPDCSGSFVFPDGTPTVVNLDRFTYLVFLMCGSGRSTDQIIRRFADHLAVDEHEVRPSVELALGQLHLNDLVTLVE
jgi:hypothetical protein